MNRLRYVRESEWSIQYVVVLPVLSDFQSRRLSLLVDYLELLVDLLLD